MASVFSPQEIMRYSKHLILENFGAAMQTKLKNSKVLVIGAGGLGCPVLLYLNAAGIGHIGIADPDTVAISNLHRQVLYDQEDIGRKKAAAAVQKLSALNPFTCFTVHDLYISGDNVAEIIRDYDLVIDGCDNFETRYVVNDCCVLWDKPLVYGSILGYQGQLALFNYCGSGNLRDIFPEPPAAEDVPDCSENGVLSTVPGMMGLMMAQEAIQVLTGTPSLCNRLLLFNAGTFESTPLDYTPLGDESKRFIKP